jgi:cytochrome c-type biogenesis protein CcmH/NrfG
VSTAASEAAAGRSILKDAREHEQQERYRQAVALYENYLQNYPRAAEAAKVTEHLDQLKQFVQHMAGARMAMSQQKYGMAFQRFKMALELRPDSQMAQKGLAEAQSHLPPRLMPDAPPRGPHRRPPSPGY